MRYRKGSFVVIPNKEALKGLEPITQVVFFWVCSFADDDGVCFPSYETIAQCAGISRRTAIERVAVLSDIGLLAKGERKDAKGEHTSNVYSVLITEGSKGGVVQDVHHPSAGRAPGVVQDVHPNYNHLLTISNEESLPTESESSYQAVDEDGTPIRDKPKSKTPISKEALRLQKRFVTKAEKELGTKPLVNMASYVLLVRALKNGFSPKDLEEVTDSWFGENKKAKDLAQITQCYSANRLTAWKVENGMK